MRRKVMGYVLASLGLVLLIAVAVILLMSFRRRQPVQPLGQEDKPSPPPGR